MLRVAILFVFAMPLAAADWPQFRGPTGDGHYTGPALPTEWGTDKNVAWKTAIPGKGWSSPIVWKGKIYLTTAEAKGDDQSLRAVCLDVATGKIDWSNEVLVATKDLTKKMHGKNSLASPTPVTDGENIYVHFGHMGTAAVNLRGKVQWTRTGIYSNPQHGNGGSPILVDGLLVFSVDAHDKQAVVALDTKDGKTKWDTPRGGKPGRPFSFGTPTVAEVGGKKQILSEGSDFFAGYDPKTGKEIWHTKFTGYSVIPKPVVGNGMVYFSTSFDQASMKAIKLGGTGDVTSSHTAWTLSGKGAAPHTPSPILEGGELYLVSDKGVFSCVDAKSGTVVWEEKLKGGYSASPIIANGNIYVTSEEGKGTLLRAGRKKEILGEFDMKEPTFASFAAVDGAMYVRTETQLYKFAK
ncbi:MAG TPA: PQQ-binding-like beta-propeller repeat protein [Gemmataceae bacterium]|jgi:outer membrane protein assembly factor BamB|nr:PQQ-binding-like beta-propeller repeat protein [Gemmataceae bacterium]